MWPTYEAEPPVAMPTSNTYNEKQQILIEQACIK